jgi:hypothetical protein
VTDIDRKRQQWISCASNVCLLLAMMTLLAYKHVPVTKVVASCLFVRLSGPSDSPAGACNSLLQASNQPASQPASQPSGHALFVDSLNCSEWLMVLTYRSSSCNGCCRRDRCCWCEKSLQSAQHRAETCRAVQDSRHQSGHNQLRKTHCTVSYCHQPVCCLPTPSCL